MLPKKYRLFRHDFLVAKSLGKTSRFPHFSLVVYPNSLGFSRIATVTSAKLDKRAVVRNHLRRLVYDSLRDYSSPYDIIVFPNKSALLLTSDQLKAELWQALNQVTNT